MIAPRERDRETAALETLTRIVVEDARAEVGRVEDRAVNAARSLVTEAEDRVADLERSARELGRSRGVAVDAAQAEAAQREVQALEAGAFDALFERYTRRVRLALEALPKDESAYGSALQAWSRRAAACMGAPAEVLAAKRDRRQVYEALLQSGAQDFHVRVDHHVHMGFVVRDLDGRTLFDARPQALVDERGPALRALLAKAVPEAPRLEVPGPIDALAVAPHNPLRDVRTPADVAAAESDEAAPATGDGSAGPS